MFHCFTTEAGSLAVFNLGELEQGLFLGIVKNY
jgi:hypothetical protein